jgi:hypothetical protein
MYLVFMFAGGPSSSLEETGYSTARSTINAQVETYLGHALFIYHVVKMKNHDGNL